MQIPGTAVRALASAIKNIQNFEYLDLSDTGLNGQAIYVLLTSLFKQNQLRHLDLSENTLRQFGRFNASDQFQEEGHVVGKLAEFVHYSSSLIHLGLSNMGFTYKSLLYFIKEGLRKSRTLQSCHLTGADDFGEEKFEAVLRQLKVKASGHKFAFLTPQFQHFQQSIFNSDQILSSKDMFANNILKHALNQSLRAKKLLGEPRINPEPEKCLHFERTLGRIEMPGS